MTGIDMADQIDAYDKVSKAIATGATMFWKSVFEDLATGNKVSFLSDAGVKQADIDSFFAVLGGAEMKIGLIPSITKGTKTYFDAASVVPSQGLSATAVSGSISIGIGISF
jgi:hypothetical protein